MRLIRRLNPWAQIQELKHARNFWEHQCHWMEARLLAAVRELDRRGVIWCLCARFGDTQGHMRTAECALYIREGIVLPKDAG